MCDVESFTYMPLLEEMGYDMHVHVDMHVMIHTAHTAQHTLLVRVTQRTLLI